MAGKKLTRKDPLAEARAARAELRAGVANAVNDALPVVGSDSNAWGGKLNQFLIDTLVLLVSKVSSINGATPNPATGDVDLSGVFVAQPATPAAGVLTRAGDGSLSWSAGGSGVSTSDNGYGGITTTSTSVTDNGLGGIAA